MRAAQARQPQNLDVTKPRFQVGAATSSDVVLRAPGLSAWWQCSALYGTGARVSVFVALFIWGYNKTMLTVIETPTFQRTASAFWDEEEIAAFVDFIAANPTAGDEIRGTKSLHKVRWSRKGMGKRGGARVIFFTRTERGEVVLVVAYAKGDTDNLPTAFLNRIKELYDA